MNTDEIVLKMRLSSAAMISLQAALSELNAAAMRGDTAGIEEARRKAHDHLDSHIDLKLEAHDAALKLG